MKYDRLFEALFCWSGRTVITIRFQLAACRLLSLFPTLHSSQMIESDYCFHKAQLIFPLKRTSNPFRLYSPPSAPVLPKVSINLSRKLFNILKPPAVSFSHEWSHSAKRNSLPYSVLPVSVSGTIYRHLNEFFIPEVSRSGKNPHSHNILGLVQNVGNASESNHLKFHFFWQEIACCCELRAYWLLSVMSLFFYQNYLLLLFIDLRGFHSLKENIGRLTRSFFLTLRMK